MGYYTNFTINISKDEPTFKDRLESISNEVFNQNGTCYDTYSKWYNHIKDMYKISKEFPNLVITVKGQGEETWDIWQTFWQNGKYQEAKVYFDSFDPHKLQKYNE